MSPRVRLPIVDSSREIAVICYESKTLTNISLYCAVASSYLIIALLDQTLINYLRLSIIYMKAEHIYPRILGNVKRYRGEEILNCIF